MKKIAVVLVFVFLIFGCKTKQTIISSPDDDTSIEHPDTSKDHSDVTTIKSIPLSEMNKSQENKAYDLGKRVLMTCNTSKFKAFEATEVTQEVLENTTIERLTKTCQKFRQLYGTFIDLKLDAVYQIQNETLYRYHALYSKKVANKELRVYVNQENLVSAIKSSDWDESFNDKVTSTQK